MKPLHPVSEEVRLQLSAETSSMSSVEDLAHDQMQSSLGERVTINVGGKKLQPFVSTLKNVPDSPLAWILQDSCKTKLDYDDDCKEYFFDRHPGVFCQVLNYFQTGKLHCPRDVCGPMFEEELRFWGIEEQQMESCCWSKYTQHRETQEHLKMFTFHNHQQPSNAIAPDGIEEVKQPTTGWKYAQKKVWEVLDEPYSSNAAKVYSWISLGFIVLSVISYIVYTWQLAEKKKLCKSKGSTTNGNTSHNSTATSTVSDDCAGDFAKTLIITYFVEVVCTGWFTLEMILRFVFCPSKSKFIRNLSNWVDVIAIIPVYWLLFQQESRLATILNLIRYVRIFRFFKLLYALHILGKTIQASAYQLLTLLFVLMFPVILFSSFLYYADKHFATKPLGPDGLTNIPEGFWWAVITMTTVGYGDKVPKSIPGQLIGGAAAICGVILLSLTTSILGSTFQQYYTVAQTQLKIPQGRRRRIKVSTTSLVALTEGPNHGKSSSIKSGDSKTSERDSGYGRSPEQSRQRREPLNSYVVARRGIRGSMLV